MDGAARAGSLIARDGTALETPLFQPVATAGSLRTLDWADLEQLGYRHLLMNTYHLVVRPGLEALQRAGGVKPFCGWRGSVLTDSGGYQAFSLAARRTVKADGLHFTDHVAGGRWHFSPRFTLEAQLTCGVDFAMCLDVCTGLPAARKQVAKDLALTHAWAREQAQIWPALTGGREQATGSGQQPPRLFGIVQGGLEEDLRRESALLTGALPFDGVAVGGLAVGEAREDFLRVAAFTAELLPAKRARYLMGVGEPADLLFAIAQGYDMFDCVQPTRMARHGLAYTSQGKLALRNARYAGDERPLDQACRCAVCRRHSRAYLRHLLVLSEHSYARLLTLHNLAFYRELLRRCRRRIGSGSFSRWWRRYAAQLERSLPEEL